jgi:hypothetical protein
MAARQLPMRRKWRRTLKVRSEFVFASRTPCGGKDRVMTDDPFNYSGKLAYLRRLCIDPRLRRTAVAVAAVIVDHANMAYGETYVSVATIIAESQVPRSTALRALRSLERFGWLVTQKRFGTSSNYRLTSPDAGAGSDIGTGVNWNATGAIQNLRRGQTGSDVGVGPVPASGHKQKTLIATEVEQAKPDASRPADPLWGSGLDFLIRKGTPAKQARSFLGQLCKRVGQVQAIALLAVADEQDIVSPIEWLARAGASKGAGSRGRLPRDSRSDDDIAIANEAALARLEASA